jgi:hypothetical protein
MLGIEDATASGDTAVTNITYGGVAMTSINDIAVGGGGVAANRMSVWYIPSPPAGNSTVSVTTSGSINNAESYAVTLWNVDLTTVSEATTTDSSNSAVATQSSSITTLTVRALAVSATSWLNPTTGITPTDGFTEQADSGVTNATVTVEFRTKETDPAGATTVSATSDGSGKYATVNFALKPCRRRLHVGG